jgi:hypothetical protein
MVSPQKKSPSTPSPSRLHVLYPPRLLAGTRWWRVGDNPTIDTPQIARELPAVDSEPNTNIIKPQTEDEENEQIRRAKEESIQLANARLPAQTTHTYLISTVLPDEAFSNMPPYAVRVLTEDEEKK